MQQAEQELAAVETQWNEKYSSIGKIWRRNWAGVVPFFAFPEEIRRSIYTTNVVESRFPCELYT